MFAFRSRSNRPSSQSLRGVRRPIQRRRPMWLERLEDRTVPTTITWMAGSGNWNVAGNWNPAQVPGSGDTASITTGSAATITIPSGDNVTVQAVSTASTDTLSIVGSLTVTTGASTLAGPLSMTGGTLEARGASASLTASGTTTVSQANLSAQSGAALSLPQLTSTVTNGYFQADGMGSVLDVSALTTVTQTGSWNVYATHGGEVKLNGLTSLTSTHGISLTDTGGSTLLDPNLTTFNGVTFNIDGTDTTVANSWTKYTNGTINVTGGSYSLPGLTDVDQSNLSAQSGGSLALPGLKSYVTNSSYFQADGINTATNAPSVLDVSALTTVTQVGSWNVYATHGGEVNLNGLTSLTSTHGISLTDTGGSTLLDPNLTTFNGVTFNIDGTDTTVANSWTKYTNGAINVTGGSYSLPGLTDVDQSNLSAQSGGSLALPGLKSYVTNSSYFQADGINTATNAPSVLDVSALTTVTQVGSWNVYATHGGEVKLNGLTSLTSTHGISLTDTGGSTLLDPNLTTFNGVTFNIDGTDTTVANSWTKYTNGTINVTGGSYSLPGLTDVDQSNLSAQSGGSLALPGLKSYVTNSSYFQADGINTATNAPSVLDVSALTTVTQVGSWNVYATHGGEVNLNGLTSLTSTHGISLTDTGGGTLLDPNLTTFNGVTFNIDGTDTAVANSWTKFINGTIDVTGGSYSLPGLTDVDQSNLHVQYGGSLALPGLMSYVTNNYFQADGTNSGTSTPSVLDVSALTTLTQVGGWNVYATNGGEVKLNGLTSLTSTHGISLTDTGSSTLLSSNLTTLNGVNISTDGTDTQLGNSLTTLNNVTFSLSGGSLALPNLTELENSNLDFSNAAELTLSMAGVVTLTGNDAVSGSGTLTLSGTPNLSNGTVVVSNGADLNLPAGTTFTGGATLKATGGSSAITLGGTSLAEPTSAGSVLLIEALNGGSVALSAVTSISGGPVVMLSNGSGSVINLSALTSFTSTGGASASNGGSVQSNITLPVAPDVWTNASSGSWDNGGNWLLGSPPTSGMNALISTGSAAIINIYSYESFSCNAVTLGSNDTLQIDGTLTTTGNFTNGGTLALDAGGKLTVGGNETESSSATINEQIGGTPASNFFGVLSVTGSITLAGTYNITLIDSFTPTVGQNFPVITFGSSSGSFSTINGLNGGGASAFSPTTEAKSFNLIVNPTPPMFTADTPPTAGVGDAYSYQFQANGTAPITFTATGLPNWATLSSSGLLTGTPPATGSFNLVVTASNGIMPNATANVTLSAQLEPPVFTADSPLAGIAGSPYSYQFQATGTGNQAITYSATGLPAWAQLDSNSGTLTGTPPSDGTFNFSVTASNGISPDMTVNATILVAGGTALTIDVPAGTSYTVADATYAGGTTFNVGANATVTIPGGTFTGGAIFNVATGAVVNFSGTANLGGDFIGGGNGTVIFSGDAFYPTLGGITLDFPGSMLQWSGGAFFANLGDVTNLGTLNLVGSSDKGVYEDSTLDNYGTIIQTGSGNLNLHSDSISPTTLKIEPGASYLIESDSGIDNLSGETALVNAGTIDKTAGTGTSQLLINGNLSNTGTIEADSGTLFLDAQTISQVAGNTLTAGTWSARGGTLRFPSGTNISANAATLVLGGSGSAITVIAGLSSNSGSLKVIGGATLTTAGNFTNSGNLTVGVDSQLGVTGNETETPAGTLDIQIGGTPGSGQFGVLAVTGSATLAGTFQVNTVNGFTASPGQDFRVMTFASGSGSFSKVLGFGSTFNDAINATAFDVYAYQAPADLQLSNVSGPATATPGQQITVTWQVGNQGPAAATGNWQDSVYLSLTQAITSTSILLGTQLHTGGLSANRTYTGNWAGALPGVLPANFYVVVQVDSLYHVPDPDRSNNTLAAGSQLAVSIPTLTIGTPASASFTATQSDVYYQLGAAAGSSFLLAMTGSPASETNAIYVSYNSLPATYQADFQSSLTGPNPTLAVPVGAGGTYYILVHNQSGTPGAFSLAASLSGLTLLESSPATVGNAGQATLTVNGLDLGPNTTITLSGTGGTITGTTSADSSSTVAYVTFNLSGVAAGTYDLKAVNPDGTTATLSGAVQVTAGGGPDLVATTVGDSTVRVGRTSVLYIQYANVGNDDAGAPLITLISTPGIPIGLDGSKPPSDAEVQVLGINHNGPAGILPPGATFRIPVYFTAALSEPFDLGLHVSGPSDPQAIDPDAVLPRISADVSAAANFPAVYAQLQQMLGSTWGQYISVLDHYATIVPASVGDPSNPIDMLGLAVNQAVAAVSTSISGTAVGTGPGVLLAGNTVTATNGTTGDVFTTNILNDGSFVFPTVTAGSYTFSVPGDLIHGSPPPITVNAGQAVTGVTVTLDPEVTLSGQVTVGGVLVAGADVSVWTATNAVADVQTDANGNYSATFPVGTYTLIVSASGLARSYSSVTLADGPQAINVALGAESAVSGTVSLSDGQTITSMDVLGVLQGSQPDPYFVTTSTSGNFLADSLTPGVYDFSISAPGYNPASIDNVQVRQGQTIDLGAIQLTPVDPVANAIQVNLRNTYYYTVGLLFKGAGAGPLAMQIYRDYFTGPGVASPFQVSGTVTPQDYNYSASTAANPHVTISGSNDPDANAFKNHPTTTQALTTTLQHITGQLNNGGFQNVPDLATWLQPFETDGTLPSPNTKTVPVATVMAALNLGDYQNVVKDSPAAGLWKYENQGGGGGFTVPGLLAGGVSVGDSRVVTGDLTFSVSCDGTVTVTPDFQVAVNDNFVIGSSGSGYVKGNPFVATLGYLESLDMAAGVSFSVTFHAPKINPGQFTVPPPHRDPCKATDCFPTVSSDCNPIKPVMSQDPNALLGPAGFGTQGLIQSTATLPYTVDFENDGSAAAQDVTVTEQLSANLDWSTFQLGSIGWGPVSVSVPAGLTQYQTTVSYQNSDGTPLNVQATLDFNVQTGLLTVNLASLDPQTALAPTGAFDGFLYPEDGTGVGSGYVEYSVQPKAGLSTDSVVNQQASVVFDTNAPLATNVASNPVATVVNKAPVSEPAGTTAPTVEKISTLLGTHYSDADRSKKTKPGIAIIAADGDGTWQYSTNGKTWLNVGAVATTSALLLPQADQLRFLPAGLGTDPANLFYVAWDGSSGTAGHYVNASLTGGGSSFSAGAGELDVTFGPPTLTAPVWLASTTTLTPVLPAGTNNGETVDSAFTSVFSGNNVQSAGIAVTGLTGRGTWEYELYNSSTQTLGTPQKMPKVSASNALVLGPNDVILFVPALTLRGGPFAGLATLSVHAWDGAPGADDGKTVNLSKAGSTGGKTDFSSSVLTAKLYFDHAPTQNAGPVTLTAIAENAPSKAVSVATLLKDVSAADADKNALGIALSEDSGPGTWQYELAGGTWQNVPTTLSDASVLLLPSSALLRFDPTVNQSDGATLMWEAWDGTQGSAGQQVTPSGTGGAFAFSSNIAEAKLTINASTRPPAWTVSSATLPPVLPGTTGPQANTVGSLFRNYFSDPNATSMGIAVSAVTGTKSGTWMYSTDGGTTYQKLPTVSATKALLLSAIDLLAFVPNTGFLGTVSLTAYAWDGGGTGNTAGGMARPHGSDFSSTTLTATCLVNTAPELTA